MNCIDKGIESMKRMGYTHFSNIPNVQLYINRQYECMMSLKDEFTSNVQEEEEEEEKMEGNEYKKEHYSLPTLEQAQEFTLYGGEITINTYCDDSVFNDLYSIADSKEQATRVNALLLASAYLECYPSKRVVNLEM